MPCGIPNWGTDIIENPLLSVRFVNMAIEANTYSGGPAVEVGIEGRIGLYRVTEVRSRNDQPQGRLPSGKWLNIEGVVIGKEVYVGWTKPKRDPAERYKRRKKVINDEHPGTST